MKKTTLTDREAEVLQTTFNFDGDTSKTALLLGITEGTVKFHLHKKIFNKLQVNTLCGAFRTAQALNLIDLKLSIRLVPPTLLDASPALSSAVSNSDC